jgi:flagellar basal body rod protein FlgC
MKLCILLSLLLSIGSCLTPNDKEVETFFKRLSVLTIKKNTILSNIHNINTTRTSTGGPYIPVKASNCKNGSCAISPIGCLGIGCAPKQQIAPILKYLPSHPDSNSNGYVAFPNINIQKEKQKLKRVELAIKFLFDAAPIESKFFFSKEINKYFNKYPSLEYEYNFEKLLQE